jgi:hypothetical protein
MRIVVGQDKFQVGRCQEMPGCHPTYAFAVNPDTGFCRASPFWVIDDVSLAA